MNTSAAIVIYVYVNIGNTLFLSDSISKIIVVIRVIYTIIAFLYRLVKNCLFIGMLIAEEWLP